MRVWLLSACLVAALAGKAPLQCASEPEPAQRGYETPAEALYKLGQQFKGQGDDKAWRSTLEFLIARYPNDRYAAMAREDLDAAK